MIIVYLTGGLGNQMFQYATARRLAEKHSTILKLDINGFEDYKLRRYNLHCFHIWEHLATKTEIGECLEPESSKISKIMKFFGLQTTIDLADSQNLWEEKDFHFNPGMLEAPNNIYLNGYWQSEKYFADIKDILYREFTIKYPQDTKSQEISQMIQSTESISLHIRRTDYITNPVTNQVHGICSLDYYQKCVNYLVQKVTKPHLFIFSDDHQWVKDHLKLEHPMIFVEHNDASRNYEDLRLMSQCKHNIIANSSFSWWGAWLNQNPDKIVYAPQKWFNDQSKDTKDLIPDTWIQV